MAVKRVGQKMQVDTIDLYNDMQTASKSLPQREGSSPCSWAPYFCDGLHFTSLGNMFVADRIKEHISEKYPKMIGGDASPLPLFYPHW